MSDGEGAGSFTYQDSSVAKGAGPRALLDAGNLLVGAAVDVRGLGLEGDGYAEVEL
jgi:hypothetical protein